MKTLINGCSFSRGPNSWPYYLKSIDQKQLVNLAQAGAGNSFIHESTISELSRREYDLVLIMWSGISRIDYKVGSSDFVQSKYTSLYQHTRNDWPEKIVEPVDDQLYVEKDWVFGCGHINREQAILESNLFTGIYKHLDYEDFVYHFLIKVLSLQNTLLAMNIPYVFSFYNDYKKDLQMFPNLCKLIKWQNILLEPNIYTITKNNNWFDQDGIHPGADAHRLYAEHLDKFIMGTK